MSRAAEAIEALEQWVFEPATLEGARWRSDPL